MVLNALKIPKHTITLFLYKIFRTLLLLGLFYVILYPLLHMLSHALNIVPMKDPGTVWIPDKIGLNNFRIAFAFLIYPKTAFFTFYLAAISTLLQIVTCSITGYGLARFKFKYRSLFLGLVIFTIIVPPQTIIMPLYMGYRFFDVFGILRLAGLIAGRDLTINLLNTPLTFWIPSLLGVGLRSGLFILIFRQFYAGIPQDLENAAKIDGCNHWGIYVRVMLPIALPALITTFLLSFVWHWNDYHLSSLFFQAQNEPLSVLIHKFGLTASGASQMGAGSFTEYIGVQDIAKLMSAACILSILPVLILYIFTQRYYLSVGAYTGIKG